MDRKTNRFQKLRPSKVSNKSVHTLGRVTMAVPSPCKKYLRRLENKIIIIIIIITRFAGREKSVETRSFFPVVPYATTSSDGIILSTFFFLSTGHANEHVVRAVSFRRSSTTLAAERTSHAHVHNTLRAHAYTLLYIDPHAMCGRPAPRPSAASSKRSPAGRRRRVVLFCRRGREASVSGRRAKPVERHTVFSSTAVVVRARNRPDPVADNVSSARSLRSVSDLLYCCRYIDFSEPSVYVLANVYLIGVGSVLDCTSETFSRFPIYYTSRPLSSYPRHMTDTIKLFVLLETADNVDTDLCVRG